MSRQPFAQFCDLARLAFPDHEWCNSEISQRSLNPSVSSDVRCKLVLPERTVALRCRRSEAVSMAVPEASVDKHGPPLPSVCDVWRPWQVSIRDAIAMTKRRQDSAHSQFRGSILLTNASHPSRRPGVKLQHPARAGLLFAVVNRHIQSINYAQSTACKSAHLAAC